MNLIKSDIKMMSSFVEIPATKQSLAQRKVAYGVAINDADYMVCPTIDGKKMHCPYYKVWKSMITRCYSEKCQEKHPTYIECSVIGEWLIFSNFKHWMEKQDWKGKELDKDLLFAGNKIYSPEKCIFVSPQINNLLIDSAASRGNYPQGVSFCNKAGKYRARCNEKGITKSIGSFDTIEKAEAAYLRFKLSVIIEAANSQGAIIKNALLAIHRDMSKRYDDINKSFANTRSITGR